MTGPFAKARRVVVKIGSTLLIEESSGHVRRQWLNALADDVAACRGRGQELILVSSGAIAAGRERLGLKARAIRLEEKQAAAATGQIRLAHAYQEALARHDMTVAQVLLTLEDTEARRRHLNARSTITQLLKLGAVPVINENDTVATSEIRFGDNDRLAARVAQMISADTLVLLSDIDGLYTADPRKSAEAEHVAEIRDLTPEVEAMAGEPPPGYSSGGMVTKLEAARIAMGMGESVTFPSIYSLFGRWIPLAERSRAVGFTSREDFYWALHATLTSRADEHPVFDQAFRLFWRNPKFLELMRSALLPQIRAPVENEEPPTSRRLSEAVGSKPLAQPGADTSRVSLWLLKQTATSVLRFVSVQVELQELLRHQVTWVSLNSQLG